MCGARQEPDRQDRDNLVFCQEGWCKTGLSEQALMWFMHDAHSGFAFMFLDILVEYTLLSMTVMVIPCLWYVVGMKLLMSCVKFPQAPFAHAPFGECRHKRWTQRVKDTEFCALEVWKLPSQQSQKLAMFGPELYCH